jgi:RHS repeat-associated protein
LETIERFIYDRDHIWLSFDGNGNQTHRYLYGATIDQVLADETAPGSVLWALSDNLGTVRDVTDNAGAIKNHFRYGSFGTTTGQTSTVAANVMRFGFTGRELDGETGLYYYRSRYYDPMVGRFLSEDPIGFGAQDANLYRYVGNSPTNFVDPMGLMPVAPPPPAPPPVIPPELVPVAKGVTSAGSATSALAVLGTALLLSIPVVLGTPQGLSDGTVTGQTKKCKKKREKPCKAYPVPRKGGHARHDAYANQVTGATMDYYVETPEGLGSTFDGLTPGTRHLWEVKTGYYSTFMDGKTPLFSNKRQRGITSNITYQALDQVKIAKRCKYLLTWAFDRSDVADFFESTWKGYHAYPQDVRWIRYKAK